MSSDEQSPAPEAGHVDPKALGSRLLMGAGLAAGYGMFAAYAVRFLFPARQPRTTLAYVAHVDEVPEGRALNYTTSGGRKIIITRLGRGRAADDFVALGSTCPHLGCQVHWEGQNDRFFCPCHNGTFDRSGKATGGPPAAAGQSLPKYPLVVKDELLFIELAEEGLAAGEGRVEEPVATRGPGHDPCLYPRAFEDARRRGGRA
ncbi:MAG: Rieske (2Fe-2S) protein [Planctomycetota bacterium]